MKTIFNKETYKREWVLTIWYEKTVMVIGIIITALWLVGFTLGLVIGTIESVS